MKTGLFSLVVGGIFGVGLTVSGMTKPQKVIDFLDFFGNWDPSLAFVMMGAILVTFIGFRLVRKKDSPIFGGDFHVPTKKDLDIKLISGSALFGIGWGLAGYCPGPAITSLVTAQTNVITFVLAMLTGMLMFHFFQKKYLNR